MTFSGSSCKVTAKVSHQPNVAETLVKLFLIYDSPADQYQIRKQGYETMERTDQVNLLNHGAEKDGINVKNGCDEYESSIQQTATGIVSNQNVEEDSSSNA